MVSYWYVTLFRDTGVLVELLYNDDIVAVSVGLVLVLVYTACPSVTIFELNIFPIWVFGVLLLNHTLILISILCPADKVILFFIILFDKLDNEIEVDVKIRYSSKLAKAIIKQVSDTEIGVEFKEPQRGITPGQSAVFYVGDIVLGGGKIC